MTTATISWSMYRPLTVQDILYTTLWLCLHLSEITVSASPLPRLYARQVIDGDGTRATTVTATPNDDISSPRTTKKTTSTTSSTTASGGSAGSSNTMNNDDDDDVTGRKKLEVILFFVILGLLFCCSMANLWLVFKMRKMRLKNETLQQELNYYRNKRRQTANTLKSTFEDDSATENDVFSSGNNRFTIFERKSDAIPSIRVSTATLPSLAMGATAAKYDGGKSDASAARMSLKKVGNRESKSRIHSIALPPAKDREAITEENNDSPLDKDFLDNNKSTNNENTKE